MDYYQLIATTSLTIQLTVLALLIVGFTLQRQKKFRQHGLILFSAVVLHAILVFVIMIPSFGVIALTETGLSSLTVSITMIHAMFGTAALVLGIWLVASWRFRQSLQYCAPKKRFMLVTFGLWLSAIFIGIVLFFGLYFPMA